MINVVAKTLKVRYVINDIEYNLKYIINTFEDQDILNDILLIVDSYRLNDWGAELSKPFLLEESKINQKSEIVKDLVAKIDATLAENKVPNLTLEP